MKKNKDNLVLILFCLFLLIGTIALMFRSEQIDKQKELPVAKQSNSANF